MTHLVKKSGFLAVPALCFKSQLLRSWPLCLFIVAIICSSTYWVIGQASLLQEGRSAPGLRDL